MNIETSDYSLAKNSIIAFSLIDNFRIAIFECQEWVERERGRFVREIKLEASREKFGEKIGLAHDSYYWQLLEFKG